MGPSSPPLSVALLAAVAALLLLSHTAEARSGGLHHLAARRHAAGGGAASLCGHTDYPALCMSAARGVHGRGGAAAVAQMTIQAAIRKAHEAKAMVDHLHAAGGHHGGLAKGNVETCRQSYGSALADLQTSMRALQSGSVEDLQINLSAVISDVSTCDDGFAEDGGKASPLSGASEVIRKFASNGLALSSLMNHHH